MARYSAAAGVLAVALWVIARVLVGHLSSTEGGIGHPWFALTSILAPVPGGVCAVFAMALGIVGLRRRDKARAWAVVGATIGATFLFIMFADLLANTLPMFLISEPGPQQ